MQEIKLSELKAGEAAWIKLLPESAHLRKSFLAAGLSLGRKVVVRQNNRLQGLLLLSMDNRSLAIRSRDSQHIVVEKTNPNPATSDRKSAQ